MFSKSMMDPYLKWGKPHVFGAATTRDTGIVIVPGGEGYTRVYYKFTCTKCGAWFELPSSSDPEVGVSVPAPISSDGPMNKRFGCTS